MVDLGVFVFVFGILALGVAFVGVIMALTFLLGPDDHIASDWYSEDEEL